MNKFVAEFRDGKRFYTDGNYEITEFGYFVTRGVLVTKGKKKEAFLYFYPRFDFLEFEDAFNDEWIDYIIKEVQ